MSAFEMWVVDVGVRDCENVMACDETTTIATTHEVRRRIEISFVGDVLSDRGCRGLTSCRTECSAR